MTDHRVEPSTPETNSRPGSPRTRYRRTLAVLLLLAASVSVLPSCTVPNPDYVVRVECRADVLQILDDKLKPSYLATRWDGTTADWAPLYKKYDPAYTATLYLGPNGQYTLDPKKGVVKKLTDAFLLQLWYYEKGATHTYDYLSIPMPRSDVAYLWIAVDNRAYDPSQPAGSRWQVPPWLRANFHSTSDVIYSTARYTVSTKPAKNQQVSYTLWAANNLDTLLSNNPTANPLKLGGNNQSGWAWKPDTGDQYLVLLQRVPKGGLGTKDVGDLKVEYGDEAAWTITDSSVKLDLTRAIKDEFLPNHHDLEDEFKLGLLTHNGGLSSCQDITLGGAAKQTARLSSGGTRISSWEPQSEGSVDSSTSTFSIDVQGQGTATIKVSGTVDFRVTADNKVEIGSLALYGTTTTLSGSGKQISNLSIGQDAELVAECAGATPSQPFRLCDQYSIPAAGFVTSGFVTVDGYNFAAQLSNPQPVVVNIGYNRQTFSITGTSLSGSVTLDGTTYTVTADVDLYGTFDNLAPVAMLAEPQEYWECGQGGVAQVTLQSMSFDEALPTDITSLSWYEHYGYATETLVGTGTFMQQTFGFGAHDITLEATDSKGVSHTADFTFVVGDSKIDSHVWPSDLWVMRQSPAGAYVCVGLASGLDNCSDQVVVEKDVPDCSTLPPGLTTVTWRFDDLRGNVVHEEQKVFVSDAAFFPPPISDLSASSLELATGTHLELTHKTQTQGKGMVVDEYIVFHRPGGSLASVDSGGSVRFDALVPHRTLWTVGGGNTQDVVYDAVFSDELTDPGSYRVEVMLVPTGADPADPAHLLASDWVDLEYVP